MVRIAASSLIDGCVASFSYLSPLMAEGIALLIALHFTKSKGFSLVLLESDCLILIQFLSQPMAFIPQELCAALSDIKAIIASHFSWNFNFVHRNANSCVYLLTFKVRRNYLPTDWLCNPLES